MSVESIHNAKPPEPDIPKSSLREQAITTIKILLIGGSIFGALGLLNRMVTP